VPPRCSPEVTKEEIDKILQKVDKESTPAS